LQELDAQEAGQFLVELLIKGRKELSICLHL
jgi:hypothetical protein